MKTQDILKMSLRDVGKLNDKELRKSVSVLRSTARKRYERLVDYAEKEGYSPIIPTESIMKHSPSGETVFPSVSGMDRTTLRNEFKRYKKFLELKTSTVSGTKKHIQSTKKFFEDITGQKDFTDEEMTDILSMADELSLTEDIGKIQSSTERISAVSQEYTRNKSKEEILQGAKERLESAYESQQRERNLSTSQYFDDSPD